MSEFNPFYTLKVWIYTVIGSSFVLCFVFKIAHDFFITLEVALLIVGGNFLYSIPTFLFITIIYFYLKDRLTSIVQIKLLLVFSAVLFIISTFLILGMDLLVFFEFIGVNTTTLVIFSALTKMAQRKKVLYYEDFE
jgi:hypothetical protein